MIRTAVAAAVFALAPRGALACAVCAPGQNDPAQSGFLIGTALLSVLPLLLIGSVVFWLFRRARRMEREETPHPASTSQPIPLRPAPARPAAR